MKVECFREEIGVIRLKCGDIRYAGVVTSYAKYSEIEAQLKGELSIEFDDLFEIQSTINILEKLYQGVLHDIETEYKRGYKEQTK